MSSLYAKEMGYENLISLQHYESPAGTLLIGAFENRLCLCDWAERKSRESIDRRICQGLNGRFVTQACSTTEEAIRQLDEYFEGRRQAFDIPLLMIGTAFQKLVWEGLKGIGYGTTCSYGELASLLGRPSAVRAVANANGANALSIFIPCHRVIGTDGTLTGYAGGLDAKRFLLGLEKRN